MGLLTEYLISVTGAAIVCSGVCCLVDKNTAVCKVLRLICGVFMAVVIIQPITKLELRIPKTFQSLTADASDISGRAAAEACLEKKRIILEQTEAYIQSKLDAMDCDAELELFLQEEYPYAPARIELRGSCSPFVRSYLSAWLEDNIGIGVKEQLWIG